MLGVFVGLLGMVDDLCGFVAVEVRRAGGIDWVDFK